MSPERIREQHRELLAWWEPRRLAYPWRRTSDAYAVLVSEVMLQQTQASRVVPAFERFLARFPSVRALASAPRSEVVRAWDGLGYNGRAVRLSLAAKCIVERHDSVVPSDPETLRSLPGVGPYTAAAVASIVHGAPVAAIDTNVRRVAGRVLAGRDDEDPMVVERLAQRWIDRARPGDWNQAVMDLGRTVCRARPACAACPLRSACAFSARGGKPVRAGRRQPPFSGSSRQVRGAVVRELRRVPSASLGRLAAATGHPLDRVADATLALAADGVVAAGPGAARGSPRGRVRLAR